MDDRVVLITGCSSGIGRALCLAFRHAGLHVVATARCKDSLSDLAGAGIRIDALDILDDAGVRSVLDRIRMTEGRLDILVNNAGYGLFGPVLDLPREELAGQFETNVFAPLRLIRAAFPVLRERGGIVVNIGSVSGVFPTPFAGAYCASKSALHTFSEALRMELHPFGVRVLLVQPGAIRSRFGETAQKNAQRLLSDTSLFHPWRGAILARAGASQIGATTEEDFARRCVRQVVSSRTRPIVRLGTLSHRLPLMKSLLPAALLDRVLIRKYGLFQAPGENA